MAAETGSLFAALSLTPAEIVLSLIICVLAARYAYRAAVRYRAWAGVTPWHLPPGLWAFVFFCSWLVGLLLFTVACRTTRPLHPRGEHLSGEPHAGQEPPRSDLEPGGSARRGGRWGSPGPGAGGPEHLPYAGWYHDPGGRHELRYWDGRGWTDYVSDQGVRSEDPG